MLGKKIISGVIATMMLFGIAGSVPVSAEGKDYAAIAAKLDKTVYTGNDLGAVYTKEATTFKVWTPTAKLVKVKLYTKGSDSEKDAKAGSVTNMEYDSKTGVWSVKIKGDLKNKYYTYVIYTDNESYETVDIYAKAVGVNGNRAMVVDLAATNPEGWENDVHVLAKSQTDAIIWEVQVKDFSYSETSGVSKNNRGKYLAFTETGTTLNGVEGAQATCIDYLKELGVTHVQINPFYDFASVDETGSDTQYNWGYDPKNYNVPEGSFSSNPYDGNVRINECKQMIKALHDAGIGVIMDVVYNHTYEGEKSWFNKTVPNYYYRINNDGTWSNGSGCGNDTASERTMFRKFMVDSVMYWAQEYHIDGFRFDLMGLHDVETMNAIRAGLDSLENGDKILMYGEAWDLATTSDPGAVMATQSNMGQMDERIAAFNDGIRDALKGSVFSISEKGFLQSGSGKSNIRIGIEGQANASTGWAKSPSQTVTYSSCHDNNTLYDKLVASVHGADSDYYARYQDVVAMNKLNGAVILTSQGMSFMVAGEEMARTKNGDENSYKSSVEINQIDWRQTLQYSDVKEYYKGLIKIRKAYAPFTDSTNTSLETIKYFENTNKPVLGYTIENKLSSEGWQKMAVIFNSNTDEAEQVKIENDSVDRWVIVADDKTAGYHNLGETGKNGTVTVAPSSAVILVDKESYDKAALSDGTGTIVADYYDDATKELVNTQVLTGKTGDAYEVYASNYFNLHYDVKTVSGKEKGKFSDGVTKLSYTCEKYEGKFSKVNIRFVDFDTNELLSEEVVLSNRAGESYYTPYLPGFSKYSIMISDFPQESSGVFQAEDITVEYKYKQSGDPADDACVVNVFYVDNVGNLLQQETLTGKAGEEYEAQLKEYDKMQIISTPNNLKGTFSKTEQNVIINYITEQAEEESSDVKIILTVCVLATFLLAAGGIGVSVALNRRNKKKDAIVIEEDDFSIDE